MRLQILFVALLIVFSGYSSNNKIFVINHDGSDVEGFPLLLNEKCKGGAALADFNNNGYDVEVKPYL